MCGIVGYVGNKSALDILINGLEKLEYRGYDSSGIAVMCENDIKICKSVGKLNKLKEKLKDCANEFNSSNMGISHIRWATHGAPSIVNAHPQSCNCGALVLVHNGIIENYNELKAELEKSGSVFKSETDTEVVAHLVAKKYDECKDIAEAVRRATKEIKGSYALCIMHKDYKNKLVVTKRHAPLIIGIGVDEFYAASDVPAIIEYTDRAVYLEDNQIATLAPDKMTLIDADGNEIQPKIEILPWKSATLNKMGYQHFMLKEIYEQPNVIKNVLYGKLNAVDENITLDEVRLTQNTIKNLNRIQIVACGTSLHAAMVGKYIIEHLCGIAVDVEAASEYIYRNTIIDEHTLVIGISQSGETADTITAIKQAKLKGSHILIITNRPDSTMAREADSIIPVNAGIEVSVAATKSYIAQLIALYLLTLYICETKVCIIQSELSSLKTEIMNLPQKLEDILANTGEIERIAKTYANSKDFIFISRGINYPTALEGALKLKEISYINATGYPAGELKHGPIAMLDETVPVVSILMMGSVYEKLLSNSEEAKARKAKMIAITNSTDEKLDVLFDNVIRIPETHEIFSPVIAAVPLQLFAYYVAKYLDKDIDQPRNLAKSVTVE